MRWYRCEVKCARAWSAGRASVAKNVAQSYCFGVFASKTAQGIELSLSKTLRLNELDVIGQKMKNSVKEVDASCGVVSSCAPQ